jgi:glycosyltransferase involved in cell wall biosynthesis
MEETMPKISVIVPVFNTEKYLKRCLESIINQTYQEFEVVIVNDGSTDNSQKIIDEYIKKYPDKVKCINKKNGGLSSARNQGLKVATGDYIAFVDSDDYIDVELFERLLPYIERNIDLVKFKLIKLDEEYKELEKVDGPVFDEVTGQKGFNLLVFNDILLEPACIYLYKKTVFDNNNFKFLENTYHEDFGLIPIMLLYAKKMISIDFYGYYYVQANNSITRNEDYSKTVKSANDLLLHYDNMEKQIQKIGLEQKTINNIKQYYSNSILEAAKKLKQEQQKKYIIEIKDRKLIKNIKDMSIKTLLKKIVLFLNIRLYFKLK